ncbi:MAG: hypothetical protein OES90_08830, partial [Xanthomonadales bacterium]|nr:hypothetical protein [Xanthomonadales bacterium]
MRQFTLKALNKGLTRTIAGVIALAFLYSGDDRPNQLEQVKQRGSLTMLTRNGASTYYLGADGPTGP